MVSFSWSLIIDIFHSLKLFLMGWLYAFIVVFGQRSYWHAKKKWCFRSYSCGRLVVKRRVIKGVRFGVTYLNCAHYSLQGCIVGFAFFNICTTFCPLVPSTCSLAFKVPHPGFSERLTTALCCAEKLVNSGKIKFVLLGTRKLLPKVPHQFYANLALNELVSYHNKKLRR